MIQDIHAHADLDFPTSLPAFQRLFPTYDELYQHKWQHPAIGGVHV